MIIVGGRTPYPVLTGTGILAGELPRLIPPQASQVLVISPETGLAARAAAAIEAAGFAVHVAPVPAGEAAKTPQVLAGLWSVMAGLAMTRNDVVVGLGGGAATDLAGFAAASYLRGVAAVLVPTTVLGMADAAVGGKTAIDLPEGKNLAGAFHPPAAVLADLATLDTLPRADFRAGMAEVIKAGFIADPEILRLVESDPEAAVTPRGKHTAELIERAIAMKAGVVAGDLTEQGRREILNYGHTLGHAIERAERYRFRHGDAVAIGMVYAAELARLAGRLDAGTAARHREILTAVGLPVRYGTPPAWPDLRAAMSVDKKARGATLRFIILEALASPVTFDGPGEDLLRAAFEEVCR